MDGHLLDPKSDIHTHIDVFEVGCSAHVQVDVLLKRLLLVPSGPNGGFRAQSGTHIELLLLLELLLDRISARKPSVLHQIVCHERQSYR